MESDILLHTWRHRSSCCGALYRRSRDYFHTGSEVAFLVVFLKISDIITSKGPMMGLYQLHVVRKLYEQVDGWLAKPSEPPSSRTVMIICAY